MNRNAYLVVPDCLRGIAAIAVVLFHLNHWLEIPWLASNAGIAVDFFFCLSGYVLCVAYRKRFETGLSAAQFARIRLIRLMPIIVLGTLVSALYFSAKEIALHGSDISPGWLITATLLGLLCLPLFGAPHAIGGPQVFPLNGPQYSLFFELTVNFFWILTRRFDAAKSAFFLTLIGYSLTAVFGMGGDMDSTFLSGFPRVFAAYYLGVLLYHSDINFGLFSFRIWKRLFLPACVVTLVVLAWPTPIPRLAQWFWTATVMPLLILGGTSIFLTGRAQAAALMLGQLSYPVYALQYPLFVWFNGTYQQITHRRDSLLEAALFVPLILLASFVVVRFVDSPVRAWLTPRFIRSSPPARMAEKHSITVARGGFER